MVVCGVKRDALGCISGLVARSLPLLSPFSSSSRRGTRLFIPYFIFKSRPKVKHDTTEYKFIIRSWEIIPPDESAYRQTAC